MSDKKPEPSFVKTTEGKESNIEVLKKSIEESEKKAAEYLAGWQRARADLLNYKKEEMERVSDFLKYANEEFVLKVLPILDNFEIVEKKLADNLKTDENIKGLLMIKKQIQDFLKSQKVEEVKSIGEKFDPSLHEVIEEIGVKDKEKSIIVEELQKGYKINGRLLRPAKVKTVK
ncbi:MAG: nucleotide exchange factor GrpE [Candidatus Nealsonbacteria bacterium]